MKSPTLLVVLGSTRPGRLGPAVADWFAAVAREQAAFDVRLIDLRDAGLPMFDEAEHPRLRRYAHAHTRKWSEAVDSAGALAFVTPEYNHFPPATLVNAIQYLHHEWRYKAAGVVGYGGISGGLRATQPLKQLLCNVGVMPIPQTVAVSHFTKLIGDDGVLRPPVTVHAAAVHMLDELAKWTSALHGLHVPAASGAATASGADPAISA